MLWWAFKRCRRPSRILVSGYISGIRADYIDHSSPWSRRPNENIHLVFSFHMWRFWRQRGLYYVHISFVCACMLMWGCAQVCACICMTVRVHVESVVNTVKLSWVFSLCLEIGFFNESGAQLAWVARKPSAPLPQDSSWHLPGAEVRDPLPCTCALVIYTSSSYLHAKHCTDWGLFLALHVYFNLKKWKLLI